MRCKSQQSIGVNIRSTTVTATSTTIIATNNLKVPVPKS